MYKLDIRVDGREAAAVERRRLQERERQARIFNARQRTIGVDVDAMKKEVAERKRREEEEKQRHEAFAAEMKRHDQVAELLQHRQEKDIKQLNKSLTEYRREYQRAEDRREFDLNDPDSKKKDVPARVSDDDPRLSVSGAQLLAGEDLKYEERKKLQQEQIREWTAQQKAEKERDRSHQQHADRLYDLKSFELDERAVELAAADAETRRKIAIATKEYNLALANEKSAQMQLESARTQDDNYTEMSNLVHGDMLSENPAVAQSAFGPHRVVPDRWKGMTPQQLSDIREDQERQKLEKERLHSEEREREREWERRRVAEAKAAMVLETQLNRKKRELAQRQAEENRRMADEQRAKLDHLSKEVYVNVPSDAYFSQFNTSSR